MHARLYLADHDSEAWLRARSMLLEAAVERAPTAELEDNVRLVVREVGVVDLDEMDARILPQRRLEELHLSDELLAELLIVHWDFGLRVGGLEIEEVQQVA